MQNELDIEDIKQNYMSADDAINYLGVNKSLFRSAEYQELLIYKKIHSKSKNYFYDKNSLEKILDFRKKWNDEYIDRSELNEIYGESSTQYIVKELQSYDIPIMAKVTKRRKSAYKRVDYLNHINSLCNPPLTLIQREELDKLVESDNKYIKRDTAISMLNVTPSYFDAVEFQRELKYIDGLKRTKFYELKFIEKIIQEKNDWWSKYFSFNECTNFFGRSQRTYKILNDHNVEAKETPILYRDNGTQYTSYSRDDVLAIKDLYGVETLCENDEYLRRSQAIDYLGVSGQLFKTKEYQELLQPISNRGVHKGTLYRKSILDDIIIFREKWYEEFILREEIVNKHGERPATSVISNLDKIDDVPLAAKFNKSEHFVYKRNQYLEYINKPDSNIAKNESRAIYGETDYETLLSRINYFKSSLENLLGSTYTIKKWNEYCQTRLTKSKDVSKKTRDMLINELMYSTFDINTLLSTSNISEIYSASSKELNFWLNNVSSSGYKRYELYNFLKNVHSDINLSLPKNIKYRGFNINEIVIKFVENKKESSREIYTYDEYIDIFAYLIDIPIHIEKVLAEYEDTKCVKYLSTWLYLLLHLNNGWRHGDVTRFPRLYVKDLLEEWRINNLDWFLSNTISIAQSRRIVSRIIQYDYRISKTDLYGHFFCSDTLAPAIATAIMLFEFIYQNKLFEIAPKEDEPIMIFENTYNEPTDFIINNIFNNYKDKTFKFSTRKMNRTVMTFIYNVACSICPNGYNPLLLPKYLRYHVEDMSTIEYIQFSPDELERLSHELFQRGSFGYITDTLLNLISGQDSSKARTCEITTFNKQFGSYKKVESTIRMLNGFKDREKEILDLLSEYSLEKCNELVSKIYLGYLSSKCEDIQCLFSEVGCQKTEKKCPNCNYKIPNIYVLRTICLSLKKQVMDFFKTNSISQKIRLSAQIHNKVEIFMDAIDMYGEEYVYNCIDIKPDDFIELFNRIEEVDELLSLIE